MACASPRCKNAWTASDRRTRAARSTARHTLAAGAGTGGAYLFQCAVVKGAQAHPLFLARQRALRVPRRTANGWRAQLSFAQTRRPGEGIPARTIRPRGNEVWPDESKCSCRSSIPSSPPERVSSRCPLHCLGANSGVSAKARALTLSAFAPEHRSRVSRVRVTLAFVGVASYFLSKVSASAIVCEARTRLGP